MFKVIQYEEAVSFLDQLPDESIFPTILPEYVKLEALHLDCKLDFVVSTDPNITTFIPILSKNYLDKGFDGRTPYGYSFGPMVSGNTKDLGRIKKFFFNVLTEELNLFCLLIRNHPICSINKNLFLNESTKVKETVMINLDSDFEKDYSKTRRSDIRRALHAYDVKQYIKNNNHDLERVFDCYTSSRAFLYIPNSLKYNLNYFTKLLAMDNVECFYTEESGQISSFSIFNISFRKRLVEYSVSATRTNGSSLLNSLIIHHAAKFFQEKSMKLMHLGGGISDNDQDSLLSFKKRFSKTLLDFFVTPLITNIDIYNSIPKPDSEIKKLIFFRDF